MNVCFRLTLIGVSFGLCCWEAPLRGQEIVEEEFDLLPESSSWKYFDQGYPGKGWQAPEFDDFKWKTGNAPMGYGDEGMTTALSFGDDPENKTPAYYFRTTMQVSPDIGRYSFLEFAVRRDDGAIIYVNGEEVARTNMPKGEIVHGTFARDAISGGDEERKRKFELDPSTLEPGINTLAVEVHQNEAGSSDMAFDFRIRGVIRTAEVFDHARHKNVLYFLIPEPWRVLRYHVKNREWLEPMDFSDAGKDLVQLAVGDGGVFVRDDETVTRRALNGKNPLRLHTSRERDFSYMFAKSDHLFVFDRGEWISYDPVSARRIASEPLQVSTRFTEHAFFGDQVRLLGNWAHTSLKATVTVDGRLENVEPMFDRDSSPENDINFRFSPDGRRAIGTQLLQVNMEDGDHVGRLSALGRFTNVDDIQFLPNGSLILLTARGTRLVMASPDSIPVAEHPIRGKKANVIELVDDTIFAFHPAPIGASALPMTEIPLADLDAEDSPKSAPPELLSFDPTHIHQQRDGSIGMMDKVHFRLVRWSPEKRSYVSSVPLHCSPTGFHYSAKHDAGFLSSSSGIRRIQFGDKSEEAGDKLLFKMPTPPYGVSSIGDHLLVCEERTHEALKHYRYATYDFEGTRIDSAEFEGASPVAVDESNRIAFLQNKRSRFPFALQEINIDGSFALKNNEGKNWQGLLSGRGWILEESNQFVGWQGEITDLETYFSRGRLLNAHLVGVVELPGGKEFVGLTVNWSDEPTCSLVRWHLEKKAVTGWLELEGGGKALFSAKDGSLVVVTYFADRPRFSLVPPDLSAVTWASPSVPVAPPEELQVAQRGGSSITLRWIDKADNEESFLIEVSEEDEGAWRPGVVVPANKTTGTVSGLMPSTDYEFRISAKNRLGYRLADQMRPVKATTLEDDNLPSGAPYGLEVVRADETAIQLRWSDNATNEKGYRLFVRAAESETVEVGADVTNYTLTGLAPNTRRWISIEAFNDFGADKRSSEVRATTLRTDMPPVDAPSLAAKSVLDTTKPSILLTWEPRTDRNHDGYVLYRISDQGGNTKRSEIKRFSTADDGKFEDFQVRHGQHYGYELETYNEFDKVVTKARAGFDRLGGQLFGKPVIGGDVVSFLFLGPDRIERYDLKRGAWLERIVLSEPVWKLMASEAGIAARERQTNDHLFFSGGGKLHRTSAGNSHFPDETLLGKYLFLRRAQVPSEESRFRLDLESGEFSSVAIENYVGLDHPPHRRPGTNEYWWPNTGYDKTGKKKTGLVVGTLGDGGSIKIQEQSGRSFWGASHLVFSVDGTRYLANNGFVFDAGSKKLIGSLGIPELQTPSDFSLNHVVFADGRAVALRPQSRVLTLYAAETYREIGARQLESAPSAIAPKGDSVLLFYADGSTERGVMVEQIKVNAISDPSPKEMVASELMFGVSAMHSVAVDEDGIAYFCNPQDHLDNGVVRRWSSTSGKRLAPIQTRSQPINILYHADHKCLYLYYRRGAISRVDITTPSPVEEPFFSTYGRVLKMTAAGDYLLVFHGGGLNATITKDGTPTLTEKDYGQVIHSTLWDSKRGQVIAIDDRGLFTIPVNELGIPGDATAPVPTINAGSLSASPDFEQLITPHGVILNASDFSVVKELFAPTESEFSTVWVGDRILGFERDRQIKDARVKTWDPKSYQQTDVGTLWGNVKSSFVAGDRIIVQTSPRLQSVASDGSIIAVLPVAPRRPENLTAIASETTIELEWADTSDNEENFVVEWRDLQRGAEWQSKLLPPDASSHRIVDLQTNSRYEVRIGAQNDEGEVFVRDKVRVTTVAKGEKPRAAVTIQPDPESIDPVDPVSLVHPDPDPVLNELEASHQIRPTQEIQEEPDNDNEQITRQTGITKSNNVSFPMIAAICFLVVILIGIVVVSLRILKKE